MTKPKPPFCQFNDGSKKYQKPPYQCNKHAEYRTIGFRGKNFNLCKEHAKLYVPRVICINPIKMIENENQVIALLKEKIKETRPEVCYKECQCCQRFDEWIKGLFEVPQ